MRFVVGVLVICSLSGVGCDSAASAARVQFGEATPLGRWQEPAQSAGVAAFPSGGSPAAAGAPEIAAVGGMPGSVTPPVGNVLPPQAGMIAPMSAGRGSAAIGGSGGSSAGRGSAGSTAGSAGSATSGSGGSDATGGAVASVTFDVMTAPQGGLYQPRNIGAIWVQNSSGTFMKSLEVWAGIRRTYLTKYNAAHGSMAIDVMASATLQSHKMHHAMWNIKDRSGAAAPPGKYTVIIELTDTDWTGKFKAIDFDTSLGPQTLMPAGDSYFSALKLTLQ